MVSSVVKVFEEIMKSVSAASRSLDGLGKIRAVDIGNETECHGAIAVMLQSLIGHHRAKIRAADADIDDVANAFAGVPFHSPLRMRLENSAILSRTAWTCGTTFTPSTKMEAP